MLDSVRSMQELSSHPNAVPLQALREFTTLKMPSRNFHIKWMTFWKRTSQPSMQLPACPARLTPPGPIFPVSSHPKCVTFIPSQANLPISPSLRLDWIGLALPIAKLSILQFLVMYQV